MSKDLTVQDSSYLVIRDAAKVGAVLEANLSGERLSISDLDSIKIPTGGITQWQVEDASGSHFVPFITGIIVHQHNQRAYWQGEYTGANEEPDCSARDGVTPYGNPGDEIRNSGRTCDDCPLAQFGSGKGGGQACRLTRKVYILQPGDNILPQVINLAPTSVGNMRKYLLRLGTLPYWGVVTKLGLVQAKSKGGIPYSIAVPESAGRLTDEEIDKVLVYREALLESMAKQPAENPVKTLEEWS